LVPARQRDVYNQVAYTPPVRRRETPSRGEAAVPRSAGVRREAAAPSRRPRTVNPYVALPVIGLVLLLLGMGFVAQRVQVMTLNYALLEAKAELTKLQQERTRLEAELARRQSLERVEYLARTRLGMVDPDPTQVIVVVNSDFGADVPSAAEGEPQSPSLLAAVSQWIRSLWQETATAGGRWREP